MEEHDTTGIILLNRYKLLRQIGKGGMALVFEGKDLMLERPIAIKLLRNDFSRDPDFQNRFRQEARSAANLSHPGIVTVYDFGIDPQGIFIVMEYVAGKDLKTRIQEKSAYSAEEGIPLMIQACAALGYAHRSGIVHCDVKPHNMLVTNDQRLKITDFGIARALATINAEERAEVVWGSPQYLSPEQAKGEPPSPASDVYSLGVVMYEAFTGNLPYSTNNAAELARLREQSSPTPPHLINPDISPSLEQIILKVLSREPSSRYRTADQLGRVLMTFGTHPVNLYSVPNTIRDTRPSQVASPTLIRGSEIVENTGEDGKSEIDWKTIGFALLAVLTVGGLIPFWLYVWFTVRSLLGA